RAKIPETVIDNFVDRVVYDHGEFIWYLNPSFGNEAYKQTTSDWKKKQHLQSLNDKVTLSACCSIGSNQPRELISNRYLNTGSLAAKAAGEFFSCKQ
ncbi:MAG: hypothetical protein PUJ25_04250, partial [Lachnospiraceae bacterium]|nr:hypothetical protein [Lachnospiraceae bacterium]MDY4164244.1 hypothetical protein [Lachnospiraceae bacterium]